jgi:hypothetical protein
MIVSNLESYMCLPISDPKVWSSFDEQGHGCRAGAEILVAPGEHKNEAPLYYINIYSSIIHIFFIYNK